jgi:hypothetical protein
MSPTTAARRAAAAATLVLTTSVLVPDAASAHVSGTSDNSDNSSGSDAGSGLAWSPAASARAAADAAASAAAGALDASAGEAALSADASSPVIAPTEAGAPVAATPATDTAAGSTGAGAVTAAPAPTAAGAAAGSPNLGDFVMKKGSNDLVTRVEALDAHLPKMGVQNLLLQANRQATHANAGNPCNASAFDGRAGAPAHWCLNADDSRTVGATVEWMPQGITTVADAQADDRWGERQAILVSWYDKDLGAEKGVRVTFLDPATGKYRHVLLVYPYMSGDDPTYEILRTPQDSDNPGIHAGGIAWYGNYLYVADTARGVRVFDMRYIFDLGGADNGNTDDGSRIGLHGGDYYGFGYRYVMPQVYLWSNNAGSNNGDYDCEISGPPKYSYVSVDRSTSPDRLITGEYCTNSAGTDNKDGRVATWLLTGSGLPQTGGDGLWHADSAQRLPVPNIQGVTAFGGRWFLSRSRGSDNNGHLIEASSSGSPVGVLSVTSTRWAGVGVEDLSYWPSQDAIWTVTEHPGKRVIYSCPADAPPNSAGQLCGSAG